MKYDYSIVIILEDRDNILKTLNSIYNQNYDLSKLQVIIEDISGENDKLTDYNNLNIEYYKVKTCDEIDALNHSLKVIKGNKVNFINSSIEYLDNNIFSEINKSDENIISVKTFSLDVVKNTKKPFIMQPQKSGIYDLNDNIKDTVVNLDGLFIDVNLVKKLKFDEQYSFDYKKKFIIDLFYLCSRYQFFNNLSIYYCYSYEDVISNNSTQYNKQWYFTLDKLTEYFDRKKDVPRFIQYITLYIILEKIKCNINDNDKGVLTEEEFNSFIFSASKLCKYISNDLIIDDIKNLKNSNKNIFKIPRWVRCYLFGCKIKYLNYTKEYYKKDNILCVKILDKNKVVDDVELCDLNYETIKIWAINYEKGKLYFDASSMLSCYFDKDDINIYVKYNDKVVDIKPTNFYTLFKMFGTKVSKQYTFSFSLDIDLTKKSEVEIYTKIYNESVKLKLEYVKVQSRLSDTFNSYWNYKNFTLINKVDKIVIQKRKFYNTFLMELKYTFNLLRDEKLNLRIFKLLFLRFLYYLTRPLYKNKKIWITCDKLYKAGDNGEYMYHYCLNNGKNIYYIIKKNSYEYKRLIKENRKHILIFNSLKAKLYSLNSEVLLDTHSNIISYCGFDGIARHIFAGLFNPKIICIQHGLTIQEIAQYQNRLYDNISLYCCASKYEVKNILDDHYDFNESQIKLTGLARYDGLKNNDKKIILITPTWRRNIVNSSIAHEKKTHNDNFKSSEYFRLYNSLINNSKLIDTAKKNGYKIVYLLHPAMSSQINDFTKNDYVSIVASTGDMNYEKILTESSVMVSDYSGVQFDFAYQRKPIIYYHPKSLPPHYDTGIFNYNTMAFGPICDNEDDLVNALCKLMNNDCKNSEEYIKKANDFFEYDDYDNCKRILNEVEKFISEDR